MATRLNAPVVRRPSLPLTVSDEQDLDLIRKSAAHRHALGQLSGDSRLAVAGASGEITESALLHMIFEAGLDAVRARAQEAGYAELAAQRMPDQAERRAIARRRAASWAEEA